ncbi:MAG TPA: hypothetical protein VFP50_17270 [Anaeromyxobacteraceae bacterium]|nr:hypothetical protein [Anaeromyxobacteraceae bacterium]
MHRYSALLALALVAGCAPRVSGSGEPRSETVQIGTSKVRILYWPEDDAGARQVIEAVRIAVPRTERWGGLEVPVTITIHPSHDALEAAVRRPGYAWLRAWARYATIDLQSPSTWRIFGARDEQVQELLTHELTHCAMYQRAASEWSWSYKGIPLWFREGMASQTADQGYRRGTVEDLWRFYEQGFPGAGDGELAAGTVARVARGRGLEGDPLGDPEPMYQERSDVVYGAAHYAFGFLMDRYGEPRVRDILERMRAGAPFPQAFKDAIGVGELEFVNEFRRYVIWQGWRRT